MPLRRSPRHVSNRSRPARKKRRGLLRRYFGALRDPNRKAWKKVLFAFWGMFLVGMIPVLALAIYIAILIPSTPSAIELQRAA